MVLGTAARRRAARTAGTERGRVVRRARRHAAWRTLRSAAVAAGIGAAAYALAQLGIAFANDPRFALAGVEVAGVHRLTIQQVIGAASLAPGRNIWLMDVAQPARRVAQLPWIAAASIHRRWPNHVRIEAIERLPAARINVGRNGQGRYALVDKDLRVLQVGPLWREDERLPLLAATPLPRGIDRPGASAGGGGLADALDAYRQLARLGLQAESVAYDPAHGVVAVARSGVRILFGSADDLDKKVALFRGIAARVSDPRAVVYVDVRSLSAPTVLYR